MRSGTDRSGALVRLFKIVTLLCGGGRLNQRDFAEACQCSERQIRRDLNCLREVEVPFSYDHEQGYVLDPSWSPLRLTLNLPEALALLLARQAIVGRAEMPFAHSAQSAFTKIAALLPPSMRDQVEAEQAVTYVGGGKRSYAAAPWGQILAAQHQRATLEMRYYTIGRDETTTRLVDPYFIVWLHEYCHLIAYCHTRRKVLNFALDGIREVKRTGSEFAIPKDFCLADYLRGAAGPVLGKPVEVAVRFDAELARWARRRAWEFPHNLTDQPDGAVVLRGTVRGMDDIRKELLTWGRHACALEPEALRESLLTEARAIAELYAAQ